MSLPYTYDGHDCSAPLGVVVHQHDGPPIRVPIIDDGLHFHERKVGPTAITRRAEVTIPIEDSGGNVWTDYINAFEPPPSEAGRITGPLSSTGLPVDDPFPTEPLIQTADVIGQPINQDGSPVGDPEILFRGYTAAVGSSEGANRARFRIHDPKDFLSVVEAGVSFKKATTSDILRYVAETFADNQPVFNNVTVDTEATSGRPIVNQILDDFTLADAIKQSISDETIQDELTFSTNRDTLVDVLSLVTNVTDARVWFEPDGESGITLRAVGDDSQQYDLTPGSSGPPRVIANNSLYEMRPFNAVRLKGATKNLVSVGPLSVDSPFSSSYPEAVATYPPLVERYGSELIESDTSKTANVEQLKGEAKAKLKGLLDEVSGGSMTLTLSPMVRPYDRVEATPACSGITADVNPLRYEVQEATHRIVPSDNNLPQTEVSVSVAIDPSQIEIQSSVKDTETGEGPTDSPAYEEYDYTTAA